MLREYDEDQSGELEFREFLPFYEELTRHIKDIKHGYSTPHADGPQVCPTLAGVCPTLA